MQAVAENFPIIFTALLLSFALCWWGLTHYALAAKSLERSDTDRLDADGSDAGSSDADRVVSPGTRGRSMHTGNRSTTRRPASRHRAFKQAGRISAELKSMAALHTQIRQTQQTHSALSASDQAAGINSARLEADSILIDDTTAPSLSKPAATATSKASGYTASSGASSAQAGSGRQGVESSGPALFQKEQFQKEQSQKDKIQREPLQREQSQKEQSKVDQSGASATGLGAASSSAVADASKTERNDATARTADVAKAPANLSATATQNTTEFDFSSPAIAGTTTKKNQTSTPDTAPKIPGLKTRFGLQTDARKDQADQRDSKRAGIAALTSVAKTGDAETGNTKAGTTPATQTGGTLSTPTTAQNGQPGTTESTAKSDTKTQADVTDATKKLQGTATKTDSAATSNAGAAVVSKSTADSVNAARPTTQTGVFTRPASSTPFANKQSAHAGTSSSTTQKADTADTKPGPWKHRIGVVDATPTTGSADKRPTTENTGTGVSDNPSTTNKPIAASANAAHATDAKKLDKVVRAPLPQTEKTTATTDSVTTKATAQSDSTQSNTGNSSARTDRETAPSIAAYQLRREQLNPAHPQDKQAHSVNQTNRLTELKTPGPVTGADDSSGKLKTPIANSDATTDTPLNTDSVRTGKRPDSAEQKDTPAERYQTAAKLMPAAPTDEARLQVKPEEINRVTRPAQPASGSTAKSFIRPTTSPDKESASTDTQVNKTSATETTETTETTVKTDSTPDNAATATATAAGVRITDRSATATSGRTTDNATTDNATTDKTPATGATESPPTAGTTVKPVNNLLAAVKQASKQDSTPAADTAKPSGSPAAFNDASDLENALALEAKDQLIKDLQAQVSALRSEQNAAQSAAPDNSERDVYQQQLADTKEALQLSQQKVGKLQLTLKAVQSRQSDQPPAAQSTATHKPHGRPALSSKVRLLEADSVVRETAQR